MKTKKLVSLLPQIKVGSILVGRGLKIRILRIGLGVILVERIDLSPDLPRTFRIHPWSPESINGLSLIG